MSNDFFNFDAIIEIEKKKSYNKAIDDLQNKFIDSVNENYFFAGEFKRWVLYAIKSDAEQLKKE